MLRLSIFFSLIFLSSRLYAQNEGGASVLREGTWLKIGVTEKGIYKIDRALLQAAGVNLTALDPAKFALFGNGGGGMLPQSNAISRPYDLLENAIVVVGEEDGSFGTGDHILFYGNSADRYSWDADCECYDYEKNLYSDTTFYFLRLDGAPGKRIETRESMGNVGTAVNEFDFLYAYETDLVKLWESGRYWVGETFSSNSGLSKTFPLDNGAFVPDSEVSIRSSVVAQSAGLASFDLQINGASIGRHELAALKEGDYQPRGTVASAEFRISANLFAGTSTPSLTYIFNRAAVNPSSGYLDYFFLVGKKPLRFADQLLFRNSDSRHLVGPVYEISNAAALTTIWDITNPVVPVNQLFGRDGELAKFSIEQTGVSEFIAFSSSQYKTPVSAKTIPNQNLKDGRVTELVIVTHPRFLTEANRLANFRRTNDGLEVKVATVGQIYNEFSSGMQDVSAIRDYVRYLYQLDPSRLKYLLLFGDCSYDYKKRVADHNFVPVYQSRESYDQITSFSSDDYFGFLDEEEGEWVEDTEGDHLLDIGVGRIPAVSTKHAGDIVNKIINYSTDLSGLGDWRNNVYFFADDGDANIHPRDADRLASFIDTAYAQFNVRKIYLDAFKQELIDSRPRSPETYEAIKKAIHEGAFIFNYSGHGNATVLTDERVIVVDSLVRWSNGSRLPLIVTATCEFGRYDNPAQESGAENLLRNPNGGAIALVTTTRAVYSYTNFILNQAFYREVFKKQNGQYPRLGDVIRGTKNNSLEGPLNRNFALLGDPSLRLNYPSYQLKITHLNGQPVDAIPDTVSAMNKVRVEGIVVNGDGVPVPTYAGELTVDVFDKPSSFTTRGDESQPASYLRWSNSLFRGKASIEAGAFEYEFVVPKNTSYQQARGKILMYAKPASGLQDANGATIDFFLGGSKPPMYNDTKAPEVSVFINDEHFKNGQQVNASPLLLVKLADESGINISGKGIGQNVTFQLDEGEQVVVNDYYLAELNDFTRGKILYPLNQLDEGRHTLTVKAWDTFSNSTTSTISFVVSNKTKVKITNVLSFPNPAQESVVFRLEHDRGDHLLSIRLELMDQKGAIVDIMEWQTSNTGGLVESPTWNRNFDGQRVENGIYIYRLFVTDEQDGNQNFAFGKLILTN